jgi:hypothetical protein
MAYQTLSASEARSFLASQGQRRVGPHAMTKRILHWPYCARCGLLALNNDESRRAIRRPCVTEE